MTTAQILFEALRAYDLPVGVYVVRSIDGVETIVQVNYEFLRIFGFDAFEAVEGTPVLARYSDRQTYEEFLSELRRAAAEGRALHSHHEKLKAANGDPIPLEVHVRADFNDAGEMIGRTGIVVPISDLELLLGDIGKVLHRYSHTIVSLRMQFDSIQRAISSGDDPFGHPFNIPTYQEAEGILDEPADLLVRALGRILEDVTEGTRAYDAFEEDDWELLRLRHMLLENYKTHILEPELRPATLLMAARDVIDVFKGVESGYLPKQACKDVQRKAEELERLVCLFEIHQSTGQILEMEHEVLTARELALYSVRPRSEKETLPASDLIAEAYRALENFATSRDIEVNIEPFGRRRPQVRVLKRDMVRVVQNLLHNAIKYSWSKPTDPVWIDLRYGIDEETGMVAITVENYGVPIMPDEIDSGKIYELGYRGRMSGDRSRRGTGIGLYDARRVVQAHGGEIRLESRPASGYEDEGEQQPYITSATVLLPAAL